MMTRKAFFDAVREFAPGREISSEDFGMLDSVARRWRLPEGDAQNTHTLRPSTACHALIKQFEGCARKRADGKLDAYPDPGSGGDPWTIGWGSTGPDIKRGTVWTQEQADERFAEHVEQFAAGVANAIGDAATAQHEFDAMVSLAYNIGLRAFRGSTLLKKHLAGDKAASAGEFAKWNKAGGRIMFGLSRRRQAEQAMYRGRA